MGEGSNVVAERETRLEAVTVILQETLGAGTGRGDSEDGQMSVKLRNTWVLAWL